MRRGLRTVQNLGVVVHVFLGKAEVAWQVEVRGEMCVGMVFIME